MNWTFDYAQLQKIYGASNEPEKRYSPAQCIGSDMKTVSGSPDPAHVSSGVKWNDGEA